MLKSARQHFYPNVSLISKKLSFVSCLLVVCEILVPLFNTWMIDHMYSCHNSEKLTQEVQKQLSSKPSTFSGSFIEFSESA